MSLWKAASAAWLYRISGKGDFLLFSGCSVFWFIFFFSLADLFYTESLKFHWANDTIGSCETLVWEKMGSGQKLNAFLT